MRYLLLVDAVNDIAIVDNQELVFDWIYYMGSSELEDVYEEALNHTCCGNTREVKGYKMYSSDTKEQCVNYLSTLHMIGAIPTELECINADYEYIKYVTELN